METPAARRGRRPRRRRLDAPSPASPRLRLALLSSLLQSAIAPLLPSYAHRFQLGSLQTAALLATTGIAALVISLPAGALSDHLGARVLTLLSGWLIVVGHPRPGLCPLVRAAPGGSPRIRPWLRHCLDGGADVAGASFGDESSLAGTITASGFGCIVGPAFAGFIAQYFGLAAPFVVAAS